MSHCDALMRISKRHNKNLYVGGAVGDWLQVATMSIKVGMEGGTVKVVLCACTGRCQDGCGHFETMEEEFGRNRCVRNQPFEDHGFDL